MPHGARRLPHECVAQLRAADLIIHAGDIATVAVLDDLRRIGPPVEAVYGNIDEPALRELLPEQQVIEVEDARIGLVHDAGSAGDREQRLAARFPGCHAVVYGHTHMPWITQTAGVWILNPGSPTERRRSPARSMLVLDVAGRTLRPRLVTFT